VPIDFKARPGIAGKKAVLITACTAPWPYTIFVDESRGAINAMRNYTRKIDAAIVSKLVFTDTRFLNVKGKRERFEQKAYAIGQKIF
jgi:hypothetical protein